MSTGHDPGCECCEGREPLTPVDLTATRAGLEHVPVRVGTHGRFKASMLLAAGREERLARLTARTDDDPAVALMDAWAMVLDVLAFYQERVANEHYLRTATERRSVLELARAVGYELRPAVSATTALAFTVEDAPGAPLQSEIAKGTRVQSIPGQNERPQTFETEAVLEARAEWNALRPRRTQVQTLSASSTSLVLAGLDTRLAKGDAIAIVGAFRATLPSSDDWRFRVLTAVDVEPDAQRTTVSWAEPLGSADPVPGEAGGGFKVHALRRKASLFGHNAPDWRAVLPAVRDQFSLAQSSWPGALGSSTSRIYLDAIYDGVLSGTWVVLVDGASQNLYRVQHVRVRERTNYTLTAKVTRVAPDATTGLAGRSRRRTVAWVHSEELVVAPLLDTTPVVGDALALETAVVGLEPGRRLVIAEPAPAGQAPKAELARLARVEDGGATLVLERELSGSYDRQSVQVHANVVLATHGETRTEPVGSGDAGQAFSSVALRGNPLTYVPSEAPGGASSTLGVRVNGLAWSEAPHLFERAASDRVFTVRHDDDGRARVLFGDGTSGARAPSGRENVVASYRVGSGPEGEVRAGQLSLLASRPLGVRSVVNPIPATGAAPAEQLADARVSAPLGVTTLGRIVSIQDYEDYARAFAGVGKAQASVLWDGEKRVVHVTIAGPKGQPIATSEPLYARLRASMDAYRDPLVPLRLHPAEPRSFDLEARVVVAADDVEEAVLDAVREELLARFGPVARGLAQPATRAEVLAVVQGVRGVVAVALDALHREGQTSPANGVLVAQQAHKPASGPIVGAELLSVRPLGVALNAVTELGP